MPLPFLTGRQTTPKRSSAGDAFLEFRSELNAELNADPGALTSTPLTRPTFPERSAISPALAFALGVAGLVTAVVAYYQLVQVISTRPPAEATTAAPAALPDPVTSAAPLQAKTAPTPAPILSPPAPPLPRGWVALQAPIELQVFEGRRLLGTSKNSRFELPPGSHTLTLVSDAFEIRQTIPITVTSNRTTPKSVTMPAGSISLSALPWAQAWIDGVPVGTTPLANIPVPVGVHEIVWTHPALGERRQSVIAKAKTPVRVGVDFTK